jgi:hypothetical protein
MNPDQPRRFPRPAVLLGSAALLVVAAAGVVAVQSRPATGTPAVAANQRPPKLPSAVPAPAATVTGPDGATLSCPTGAVPAIVLTRSTFTPGLAGGTVMNPGRYRISMSGTVQNETTQPIAVRAVTVHIGGQPWQSTVRVAGAVPAQSSVELVIEGTYQNPRPGTPDIHADLSWTWQAPELAPCGHDGLIEDD